MDAAQLLFLFGLGFLQCLELVLESKVPQQISVPVDEVNEVLGLATIEFSKGLGDTL